MADRALLRELTEAFGPSGFEGEPAAILSRELAKAGELSRDGLGSVVCRVAGGEERPRLMVSAHMDEVGFMVKSVTSDGYIKFLPIGGWWSQVLLGQRVMVRTRLGDFPGVIGSKPPHELTDEERKKLPDIDKMFIDVGCSEGFDVTEKLGVRPGDPVVPASPYTEMADDLVMAKAWDDRGGCAMLVEVARGGRRRETPQLALPRRDGPGGGRAPGSADRGRGRPPRRGDSPRRIAVLRAPGAHPQDCRRAAGQRGGDTRPRPLDDPEHQAA